MEYRQGRRENCFLLHGLHHHHGPSPVTLVWQSAEVLNVYTIKEYRRQGHAAKLLTMLFEEFKRRGVPKTVLEYTDDGLPYSGRWDLWITGGSWFCGWMAEKQERKDDSFNHRGFPYGQDIPRPKTA